MADLKTEIAGVKLKNPTVLASGILGVTRDSIRIAADNGAGAATIKSITKEPRKGHDGPIIVEVEGGLLNAVGYSNMGVENAKEEFKNLKELGIPVFASIVAEDARGFGFLAKELSGLEFSAIELALSCPHTPGYGILAGHNTPENAYEITKTVKGSTKLPVIVKLSPNTTNLGEIAKSAEMAGAAAINMGNTLGPGMVIDPRAKKPVLGFKVGGMSGPAIKPIIVRSVYDIYETVRIPIIATGGITTGLDAVEMMMAGAAAVGIGTGIMYKGPGIFKRVCDEISEFMHAEGYSNLKQMMGAAHK
ncbi:MAG: dihydroorotate dehydrogenase [Candidatus Altiarchaeota archaeon]